MSEDLNQDELDHLEEPVESKKEVQKDFQGLLGSTKKFLKELLDIRTNTDQEATKEAIIADIPMKGHTSWILICSIFIASVGLNANSTAVVIGAMLISPLMGPILGMGMSLAINDIDTLRRVKPDIRDVLIAFFGGLALVIARAKKGTIASVIFGVAIATALMPPLCTVGYGLAIGNMEYAGGALLLFGINTIFIALATFLVLKILRFPMVRYANSQRRRLIARLVSITALTVMIPAGYIFWGSNMEAYDDLKGTELKIIQGAQSEQGNQIEMMEELYKSQKNELLSKDEKIRRLESQLLRLNKLNAKQIPFQDISKEAQANYENLEYLAFSNAIRTDFKKLDTVSVFEAKWKRDAKRIEILTESKEITQLVENKIEG
ncbi:hypothetical protein GQR58_030565 [Nymphon striatum]|nr:hypothetical protein GQR58_030565 [Nymphon striatum]